MSSPAASKPFGVFGGTFNPVHYGHLRSAIELIERLDLASLSLMPSARPPHRDAPECSAEHRTRMVELAVAGEPLLHCDSRELGRSGASYTIDSLRELRDELGAERSLVMVMGCDAVLGLDRWYRWEELLDYAHIAVIARPGWSLPQEGPVARWLDRHCSEDPAQLKCAPRGTVVLCQLRPLDISSTEIRDLLAVGRSARFLTPAPVLDYIEEHGLY